MDWNLYENNRIVEIDIDKTNQSKSGKQLKPTLLIICIINNKYSQVTYLLLLIYYLFHVYSKIK